MLKFTKLIGGVVGAGLALAVMPAVAQTTSPDEAASADLVLLLERAKSDAYLGQFFQEARQQNKDSARMRQIIQDQMRNNRRAKSDWPVPYKAMEMVQVAEMRGRKLGEMLTADLDNDGTITTDELRATLEVSRVQGVAEAFFSSDQDGDGVLSSAEIRLAAEGQIRRDGGFRGNQTNITQVLDFDDDGMLTESEFERAMRALGL